MAAYPLVVTLGCAGEGWRLCEDLRRRYFPPERNVVPVHIALFHRLPGEELDAVKERALFAVAARPPFPVRVSRVRSLGRGVAFAVESPELMALQRALAHAFDAWLVPQDRAPFAPHITIQNKTTAMEAKRLFEELAAGFAPFTIDALGLEFWHYRGGPWEPALSVPFPPG